MLEKTIAVVALDNQPYRDLEAKLREAAKWVEHAASLGADLVVLPEALNCYAGDVPSAAAGPKLSDLAFEDWRSACETLIDAARRHRVALTVPVLTREPGGLTNSFFLLSRRGEVLGRYQKRRPTGGELTEGFISGPESNPPIEWEGVRVGGAICFDCYFPEVFEDQAHAGAELFLIPSLTPGGGHLNFYALRHSTPIALSYPAWSRIIDVDGRELAAGGQRNETLRFGFGAPVSMATINFDRVVLYADENQDKMLDVQRKYGRRVRCRFDQDNVIFILESRDEGLPIRDVVRDFGLVTKREYFDRSREKIEAATKHLSPG